jgi:hypothetical protein
VGQAVLDAIIRKGVIDSRLPVGNSRFERSGVCNPVVEKRMRGISTDMCLISFVYVDSPNIFHIPLHSCMQ